MEPEVDEPAPPDGLSDGGGGDDGDPERPWWHRRGSSSCSAWRCCSSAGRPASPCSAARTTLRARVGRRRLPPGHALAPRPGRADVAVHAEQGHRGAGPDGAVRRRPTSCAPSSSRAGVMAGQLRTWGAAEANESGTGMAWMGMPVPIDRMPGMASDDELERLKAPPARRPTCCSCSSCGSTTRAACTWPSTRWAGPRPTRPATLAESIVKSQEFELDELRRLEAQLTAGLHAAAGACTGRMPFQARRCAMADVKRARAGQGPVVRSDAERPSVRASYDDLLVGEGEHQPAEHAELGLALRIAGPLLAAWRGCRGRRPRRSCAAAPSEKSVRATKRPAVPMDLLARRRSGAAARTSARNSRSRRQCPPAPSRA